MSNEEKGSLAINNETARRLLAGMQGDDLYRFWIDAAPGEERLRTPMPRGWLSHARRRTARLRLRSLKHLFDSKLAKATTMSEMNTFRFVDDEQNRQLIKLLKSAKVNHTIGDDGTISYACDDEEMVENELICRVRDRVFPTWQVVTCPESWLTRYREYMRANDVPVFEELSNGEVWFLIPRRYRPHTWKLKGEHSQRRAVSVR